MESTSDGPAAVTAGGLTVVRGATTVLDRLDVMVRAGTVTGLIGPSGCGKTTLIRSIAGVQQVRSGTVDVLGAPAGSMVNRRRVTYMTQASSVYPDLTVSQNLAYHAALHRVGRERTAQVLDDVDLAAVADRLTGDLSGGQRTRVSLACALLPAPALLLLDEPTVGLDPVLRRDLWVLFGRLAAGGSTLVVSSHVMDEAARCDRVLLMRAGRLLADATPDELRAAAGTDDLEAAFLTLAEREAP